MKKASTENGILETSMTKVIVIGRQFGSGGRRIGKLLAAKTGYRYYDSELLSAAAEKMGVSREVFDAHDEKRTSSRMRSLLQGAFGIADNFHPVSIGTDRLYVEQSKVIREICKNESCIIVGRTADYILRNHPGLTSVFLHAPLEWRAESILRRGEAETLEKAMEKARKYDRERESYYNFYTGKQLWGKSWNYTLTLDSSQTDEETIVDIIIKMSEKTIGRNEVCRP